MENPLASAEEGTTFQQKTEKNKHVLYLVRVAEMVEAILKGALQLLIDRCGYICFAQVPELVSTKSAVVLIIGNSKSNHLGAQGIF